MPDKASISKEMRNAFRRPAIEMVIHLYDLIDFTLDLETTGLDFKKDEPIQIGVVDLKTKTTIINEYVMPSVPISKGALRVFKKPAETIEMTSERIYKELEDNNALSFEQAYPFLFSVTEGKLLAGYNVTFDAAILDGVCRRKGLPPLAPAGWVDMMPFFNLIKGHWTSNRKNFAWQKLSQFNIEKRELHDAVNDCLILCDYMHYIVNGVKKTERNV